MTQNIDESLWEEFKQEQQKLKKELENKIMNSEKPTNEWVREVVEKVNIGDIASEHGIVGCPHCDKNLYFDDTAGLFICYTQRFKKTKCFAGGIVDFMEFCLR